MTPHELHAKPNGQILPQAVPVAGGDAEEREIPVAEIGPDPGQPRKYFDPERDKELEASLREHGQLNAIIVYLAAEAPRYRLIAGERRWRAFQRIGKETIRARVLKARPDAARCSLLMLVDNEQRQDLHDIERGDAYLAHLTLTGCTASALAQKVGKHVSTVTRAVALVKKLPEDLRGLIGQRLPPSVAQLLTALPNDEEKRRYASLYIEGKIKSGDELAAAIRAARNGQATGVTACFACQESGVKIAVTWTTGAAGASPGQALAAAENALKIVLKDIREQGHRGLEKFKDFLSKKARTAKKAGELAAAQNELARHGVTGGNGGI